MHVSLALRLSEPSKLIFAFCFYFFQGKKIDDIISFLGPSTNCCPIKKLSRMRMSLQIFCIYYVADMVLNCMSISPYHGQSQCLQWSRFSSRYGSLRSRLSPSEQRKGRERENERARNTVEKISHLCTTPIFWLTCKMERYCEMVI